VHDTAAFVRSVLSVEMNSATDNPMVFCGDAQLPDEAAKPVALQIPEGKANGIDNPSDSHEESIADADPEKQRMALEIRRLRGLLKEKKDTQHKKESHTFYRGEGGFIISGGNFHGEYPAKALDYLAIGVQEIANISERRLERMVNPQLSDMPAFLVKDGGLNSGFMIAHCTAAACTSENKVLAHPASVDTISTSAAKEDHVSMGGFAARKALEAVGNVEVVVAIEILAACQAIEFFRPARSTAALEAVHALVRKHVASWDQDRIMHTDIDAVVKLVRAGEIWGVVAPFLTPKEVKEPPAKRARVGP
jgi:histidine ammonia-lyase